MFAFWILSSHADDEKLSKCPIANLSIVVSFAATICAVYCTEYFVEFQHLKMSIIAVIFAWVILHFRINTNKKVQSQLVNKLAVH